MHWVIFSARPEERLDDNQPVLTLLHNSNGTIPQKNKYIPERVDCFVTSFAMAVSLSRYAWLMPYANFNNRDVILAFLELLDFVLGFVSDYAFLTILRNAKLQEGNCKPFVDKLKTKYRHWIHWKQALQNFISWLFRFCNAPINLTPTYAMKIFDLSFCKSELEGTNIPIIYWSSSLNAIQCTQIITVLRVLPW